jgi:hypothetical protein
MLQVTSYICHRMLYSLHPLDRHGISYYCSGPLCLALCYIHLCSLCNELFLHESTRHWRGEGDCRLKSKTAEIKGSKGGRDKGVKPLTYNNPVTTMPLTSRAGHDRAFMIKTDGPRNWLLYVEGKMRCELKERVEAAGLLDEWLVGPSCRIVWMEYIAN